MTCSEFNNLASQLPGENSISASRASVEHLSECKTCRFDAELDRVTRNFLRQRFKQVVAPAAVRERITNLIGRSYAA